MRKSYDLIKRISKTTYIPWNKLILSALVISLICVAIFLVLVVALWHHHHYHFYTDAKGKDDDASCGGVNVEDFFARRKDKQLSTLGKILFLEESYPPEKDTFFKILIWKEGPSLERRHIKSFSNERHDPFELCSVHNCNITYESEEIDDADAVVFFLQKFTGLNYLPDTYQNRSDNQTWIFHTDQSPLHTFRFRDLNDWRNYSNIFDWSMTYKMESDVPIPYGRTTSLTLESNATRQCDDDDRPPPTSSIPHYSSKRRDVLVAIKTSDCGTEKRRSRYLTELKRHLDVGVYGRCATDARDSCSKMSQSRCDQLDDYLFFLAFEDAECEQFATEELFWSAYSKGAVPVIMGAPREDCATMLPPGSFIHTDDYPAPEALAEKLLELNRSESSLLEYHEWRRRFGVVNEHGYFGSRSWHYCRVCEALNYNEPPNRAERYDVKRLSTFLGGCDAIN